jgi:chaperonin GroES
MKRRREKVAKVKKKSKSAKSKPAARSKSSKVQKTKPRKIIAKPKAQLKSKSKPTAKAAVGMKALKPTASPMKKRSGSVGLSPVRSRVIIRRDEGEERTAGGLFIPDTAKDKPLMGRVIAVGTGSYNKKGLKRPLEVKVGDHVVFSRYTGSQIKVDNEDLLVVEESEIIGIMQD